jgi:hypothetical protein
MYDCGAGVPATAVHVILRVFVFEVALFIETCTFAGTRAVPLAMPLTAPSPAAFVALTTTCI